MVKPFCTTIVLFSALLIAGCTTAMPGGSMGVLSAIQQKTLNLATERSLSGVSLDQLGLKNPVFLEFTNVGNADLGKQHVSGTVRSFLEKQGLLITEDRAKAKSILRCNLVIAGSDTQPGTFIIFRWIDTKAEVVLSLTGNKDHSEEFQGNGKAKYSQLWIFGLGPSEKLK